MMNTLEARYRRIAAALEQRGTEVKLLDDCDDERDRRVCHAMADPGYGEVCEYCGNTGTVVPSEEVCFWRLTLANKGCKLYQFEDHWNAFQLSRHEWREGIDPLTALLSAVEQSLGLEKEAEA